MKNIAEITKALQEVVSESAYFKNKKFNIERATPEPMDPNHLPWLGIYRAEVQYDPRSIGVANINTDTDNWSGVVTIVTIIKDQAGFAVNNAGSDLEDKLDLHVKNFLDILLNDTTIKNNVDMVRAVRVSYNYAQDDAETMYMYSVSIEAELEVIVS